MNQPPRRRPPVESEPGRSPFGELLFRHRAGLGAILVVAAAAAGGWMLWERFADGPRSHRDAVLLPEAVEVRGVAEWVRGDVKSEALRAASLDRGLPLDDPELQRRLARAFDMHPWVRRVVAVELLHPAAAVIEIECREPVAMVAWQDGVLAIDADGVVLPSGDFNAEATTRYPRITGIDSSPQGAEGFPWGDPAVEEAAAIAAAIGPEWGALQLGELRPVRDRSGRMWELVGAGVARILFGSAPGREGAGEPTAAAKIARLKTLGPDGKGGRIDLTSPPAEPAGPRSIPAG